MLNPIHIYQKSQAAQLNWMRSHPFQYVALNAALIVVGIGFVELYSRRQEKKMDEIIAQTEV